MRSLQERIARAWASMDGKEEYFDREKLCKNPDYGYYEGYMADALELMQRAKIPEENT